MCSCVAGVCEISTMSLPASRARRHAAAVSIPSASTPSISMSSVMTMPLNPSFWRSTRLEKERGQGGGGEAADDPREREVAGHDGGDVLTNEDPVGNEVAVQELVQAHVDPWEGARGNPGPPTRAPGNASPCRAPRRLSMPRAYAAESRPVVLGSEPNERGPMTLASGFEYTSAVGAKSMSMPSAASSLPR